MAARGDAALLPGVERQRDEGGADAGGVRGPDRAVQVDHSAALLQLVALPGLDAGLVAYREEGVRDGERELGRVVESGYREDPLPRRAPADAKGGPAGAP